jgi:murein DD-endopeptidase MepM/ murein hydrolase activator NlpD
MKSVGVFQRGIALFLFFILLGLGLAAEEALSFALLPESPLPGQPVAVVIAGMASGRGGLYHGEIRASLLNGQGRLSRAFFFDVPPVEGKEGFMAALLAVPSTARSGGATVQIESPSGLLGELPLVIGERSFVSETIELNPANTALRTVPDPQKTAESEHLWSILSAAGKECFALDPFVFPVESTRRTSFFGDRRVFKYSNGASDTSIHAGIDYGVPLGTRVTACAPGKVVLARARIVTGNSIVVEHLPGVYSLYYHLDTIAVSEGEIVKNGSLLGTSGSTGLATGPHLHWEIRVAGENTDPDALVAHPILDRDAILTKLGTGSVGD